MAEAPAPEGYPDAYLACPICRVPAGQQCRARSGQVVSGRPDGESVQLERPHVARKRSLRRYPADR